MEGIEGGKAHCYNDDVRRCRILLHLGQSGGNLALDAAVVLSAQNLDVAVVSPVSVPRVGNQPVRSRVFHSPAQDTDSVTAQSLAVNVLVHTCPSADNQSVI